MRPSDLSRLHAVTDPRVHPDGRRIAFVVSTPDLEADAYVRRIHLWDATDGATRQLTHGPKDAAPQWSPDGGHLAFLRAGSGKDDHPQLAILPTDGGEACVLTDLALGVTDLTWSSDSAWIVVVGVSWSDELAALADDERRRRPRRITRIPYRADDEGWIYDRRSHLWLVDVTGTQQPRCLTAGPYDETAPAFRPGGGTVVFVSQRRPDRETNPGVEVYEVDVTGGDPRLLVDSGLWSRPVPLADGALLVDGLPDPFDWPAPTGLFLCDSDGRLTRLAGELDRDITVPDGARATDAGLLVTVGDRGRTHAYRIKRDGSYECVVAGNRAVTGLTASPDDATIAFTATDPADPGELWRVADGAPRRLTDVNVDLRSNGDVLATQHFTFTRDGAEIDGWVVLPAGFEQRDDIPLLLNVHGGPMSQYGFDFFDEFQVYAGAGYAVVGINPRGSSGRGIQWARALVGQWSDHGSVDMLDLEAAVDAVLERFANVSRERLGIMGGSYGGFATARILARQSRFRSAVVERGLLNFVSFGGTSDIGTFFDRMFVGRTMPDDALTLWSASPMSTAHRITTPTLIVHAEQDHRCPIEQAEQLFTMLRRNGVESELLRFADESHELSRSGAPRHRVERFDAILDWHDRHLAVGHKRGQTPAAAEPGSAEAAVAPLPEVRE